MPNLSTITDAFSDGTLGAYWASSWGTPAPSESGGVLNIPCTTPDNWAGAETAASYTFDSVLWQWTAPATNGSTSADDFMHVYVAGGTAGTFIEIRYTISTQQIEFRNNVSYDDASKVVLAFSATDHAWCRMRQSGGTLYWDTSADGLTWTNRRSITAPAWLSGTTLKLGVEGHRITGTSSTGTLDNLNLPPTNPSGTATITGATDATGTGAKGSTGTGTITGAGALTGSGTRSTTGTGVITGAGSITGSGTRATSGTGAITGVGEVVGTPQAPSASGTAAISGVSDLTGAGTRSASGGAAVPATSGVVASGMGWAPGPDPAAIIRPAITCDVAFRDSEDGPVWASVSEWLELGEGVDITRRKQHEFDEQAPATLSLRLDNRGGRFAPANPASPYYPNVRINRPIRVRAEWPRSNNLLFDSAAACTDPAAFDTDTGGLAVEAGDVPAGQTTAMRWSTGVVEKTGVGMWAGHGPSRYPGSEPIPVTPGAQYSAACQVKTFGSGTLPEKPPPGSAIASLSDDFNDNSIDAVKWGGGTWDSPAPSETGGRLRTYVYNNNYCGIASARAYQLTSSSALVRWYPPAPNGSTDANDKFTMAIGRNLDGSNGTYAEICYFLSTNQIAFRNLTNWSDAGEVRLTYNATSHAWIRIRESGGTLYFETSADGLTWTQRRSVATPAWASATDIQVVLEGYRKSGTNNYGEWDNFNLPPSAPPSSPSATVAMALRWYDADGDPISDSLGADLVTTGAYQTAAVTATAPAGAVMCRPGLVMRSTVAPTGAQISYVGGEARRKQRGYTIGLRIPSQARAGNFALARIRLADKGATLTAPAGWTLIDRREDLKGATCSYWRICDATDPGREYVWTKAGVDCRAYAYLTVYAGTHQTAPVHATASAAETTYRATHTTPSVTTTVANCWILNAAFDTSSTSSQWSAPAGDYVRVYGYGLAGWAATGLMADNATPVAAGTWGMKTYTANVASKYATMHTLALRPATATGPGSVDVLTGAWYVRAGGTAAWEAGPRRYPLFTGYVDTWEPQWEGGVRPLCHVTATDRRKILARQQVHAAVSMAILDRDPVCYYRLNETASAGESAKVEAGNFSGTDQPALKPLQIGSGGEIKWAEGVGPGTDDKAAVMLAPASSTAGIALQTRLTTPVGGDEVSSATLLLWWNSSSNWATLLTMARLDDGWTVDTDDGVRANLKLKGYPGTSILGDGAIFSDAQSLNVQASASGQYFDGKTHLLAVTASLAGGQLVTKLYIDGVEKGRTSAATNLTALPELNRLTVGAASSNGQLCPGTYSHVAAFNRELSADEIAEIWTAGTTSFAGQTVTQRLNLIADWCDISDIDFEDSQIEVSGHPATSTELMSALQLVARSDGGTVYVDQAGTLRFKTRRTRERTVTPALVLGAHHVGSSARATIDDALLQNKVTVRRIGTKSEQISKNADSIAEHGVHDETVDTLIASDEEAAAAAAFRSTFYGQPTPRISSVVLDVLSLCQNQDLWDEVLGLDTWQMIRILGMPDGAPSTNVDLYVEGIAMQISGDQWTLSLDTSPTFPFCVLNDPVRGLLGHVVIGW